MPYTVSPPTSQATRMSNPSAVCDQTAGMPATRILAAVLTVLIMLALKHHYSLASADQLTWILAPTAKLVAWLTPAHPVYESGVGYVDFTQGIIVAPACAGLNFMIMAFGLAAFCGLLAINRPALLWIWLVAALGCAYGYALWVNTLRIGISMMLYKADIYGGWLTAERVHRFAGITLYIGAIWVFFTGIRTALAICRRKSRHVVKGIAVRGLPAWLPLMWYTIGAIGVPLVNLLFSERSPAFNEHTLTILIIVVCLASSITCLNWLIRHRTQARSSDLPPSSDNGSHI